MCVYIIIIKHIKKDLKMLKGTASGTPRHVPRPTSHVPRPTSHVPRHLAELQGQAALRIAAVQEGRRPATFGRDLIHGFRCPGWEILSEELCKMDV